MAYVSITGLELKSFKHTIRFWWIAIRSMYQARSAKGNISADARTINGVHHTVSLWDDEKSMREFLVTGAHLEALKAFKHIATGKTFGYIDEKAPDWSEVHELWLNKGKTYSS